MLYIFTCEEGYAREIASSYEADLKPIQMQLDKFEKGGVLVSRFIGRTRPYEFDPRYPFLNELKALFEKALSFHPAKEQEELKMNRRDQVQGGKSYEKDKEQEPGGTGSLR